MKVKICGITRLEDALAAAEYGADALGFVFYRKSPRYIEPELAAEIIKQLPPFVTPVALFVNEPEEAVRDILHLTGINVVQFHGDESPDYVSLCPQRVIKAIRVKDESTLKPLAGYEVSAFLLDSYSPDAYGGTGKKFDWQVIKETGSVKRIILAGGLNADNVAYAVKLVRPYGIDASSGLESSLGIKDHEKVKAFICAARAAALELDDQS